MKGSDLKGSDLKGSDLKGSDLEVTFCHPFKITKKVILNVEVREVLLGQNMSEKFGNFDGFNRVVTEDHILFPTNRMISKVFPLCPPYNALWVKLFPYIEIEK